ncbi:MAG TPA: hypothetical protein VNG32_00755 [Candidatus Dormibacteraeota bacterium]|nr:hypothetical protein [Candidatus Dormibacteraeota bacterium]
MKVRSVLAGGIVAASTVVICIIALSLHAKAAAPNSFSLVVTPSPIVATAAPGQTTQLQLKILNNGTQTENLQIQPRSFSVTNTTGQIKISDASPLGVTNWISFSSPKFTIAVGQWFTENVRLAVPKDAGFSYSFALVINRQVDPQPTQGGRLIKAALAIFTLLNINQHGATRQLSVSSFSVSKHIYEWLPATFTIKFKNTGNSIVQPSGNIFIQRTATAKTPIDVLPVNAGGGYILPSTVRLLNSSWSNGFPVYQTVTTSTGASQQHLAWNWSKLSSLRIGHYTADLVAVYNNGLQDVPIQAQVSFWVIPWKILIVVAIVGLLLLFGLWSLVRGVIRMFRRHSKPHRHKNR